MTIPHVGGRTGNWEFHDPRFQRLGEIASDHGIFEWFIQDALRRGHRVGIVAGSDDHQGHPGNSPVGRYWNTRGGLAAVYATDRTRKSIWDGLYARRCYGTTLARILLDVRMGSHLMGESFRAAKAPPLEVFAAGAGPLLQVRRAPQQRMRVHAQRGLQAEPEWRTTDRAPHLDPGPPERSRSHGAPRESARGRREAHERPGTPLREPP